MTLIVIYIFNEVEKTSFLWVLFRTGSVFEVKRLLWVEYFYTRLYIMRSLSHVRQTTRFDHSDLEPQDSDRKYGTNLSSIPGNTSPWLLKGLLFVKWVLAWFYIKNGWQLKWIRVVIQVREFEELEFQICPEFSQDSFQCIHGVRVSAKNYSEHNAFFT